MLALRQAQRAAPLGVIARTLSTTAARSQDKPPAPPKSIDDSTSALDCKFGPANRKAHGRIES